MTKKRIIAAIMFTDIEGYTSFMQRDENQAIAFRDKHREIFNACTAKSHGEVIQYFGDGTLSVFKSCVEAVECAIALQNQFIAETIPVRIGIHVGDIVYSNEDIIGDAVNIASRVESCAVPGSILISDKVHDQIRNQRHILSKFLDAFDLKNVDYAIPIFAIANEGLVIPNPKEIKGKLKENRDSDQRGKKGTRTLMVYGFALMMALVLLFGLKSFFKSKSPRELSIAVLPFENLSTDEDAELFRDGITEDILNQLSKLKDLHVISRTSVEHYKNTNKTLPQIAKELGVTLILEGSVRKNGNQVRINAQLIDAASDERLWGDDYDKTLIDFFGLQSEISEEIVAALQLKLSSEEQQGLADIPTKNIEAYKLFLLGRKEVDKRNAESIERSIDLYERALQLDPQYAEALAEIANSVYLQTYYANRDPLEASQTAKQYLDKAEKINNRVSRIYSVRGLIFNIEGKKEEAKKAFERAIFLSPNDVVARNQFATYYYYNQEYEKQLEQAEIAYRLDPLSFAAANGYFTALVENYRYQDAENLMRTVEKSSDSNNRFVINRSYFRLYSSSKQYDKSIPYLKELADEEYAYYRFLGYAYAHNKDTANARKILKKVRKVPMKNESDRNYQLAFIYSGLGIKDSVFYHLDTSRTKHSHSFDRELDDFFECIKEDPRYPYLLKAHGIEFSN